MKLLNLFLLLALLIIEPGCFKDKRVYWHDQQLEWTPPNKATGLLTVNVSYGALNDSTITTIPLQVDLAGAQLDRDISVPFGVVPDLTSAVEGKHFEIMANKNLTIPSNNNFSNTVELRVFAKEVNPGENLTVVLRISDQSDIKPMPNYMDFVVNISKKG